MDENNYQTQGAPKYTLGHLLSGAGFDGRVDGQIYNNGTADKPTYMTSGFFTDHATTMNDAYDANNFEVAKGLGFKGTQEDFNGAVKNYNNKKANSFSFGDAAQSALGLGQLYLGYLGYEEGKKTADKQRKILDQQYANNEINMKNAAKYETNRRAAWGLA